MNTAGSVAYGWGALIVAAGVAFYWAKKDINARRFDQMQKGQRPIEKLTWQERIAKDQQNTVSTSAAAGTVGNPQKDNTPQGKSGGIGGGEGVTMNSRPTGVDTKHGSAGSKPNSVQ